jgi:protein TonB
MASPKELTPLLPDTLPEDFSEWDGKAAGAPSPVKTGERDAWEAADSFSEAVKPHWQSADNDALLASVVDGSRDAGSASSASVFVKQQEDLTDWEGEANSQPWPVDRTEWEQWESKHSFSKTPKPAPPPTDRESFLAPAGDKARNSDATASAPVVAKQQKPANELVDGSPSRDSRLPESHLSANTVSAATSAPNAAAADGARSSVETTGTGRRKADEAVFQLFSPKTSEVKEEQKPAKKKWMAIAGISAGAILVPLLIMIPLLHHGAKAAAKDTVQPLPVATDTPVNTETPTTPSATANKPPTQTKPSAATERQPTTDSQPGADKPGTTPDQAQSTSMNDQLTAPTRIPKQEAENSPPPAGSDTADANGLGGGNANSSMFSGHSQPTVRVTPSRPVAISSGIAKGMLIQSPPPVYPPLAKTAHVAGTVELHATIATNGTIKDLHAVNGPVMLRQAAIDAVRSWRYQPYKLNDQPVEVETTINIVFTLGG